MSAPVVLLHGFAATARHWDRVLGELPAGLAAIALNLADAEAPAPDAVTRLVSESTAERLVLVGYSMGARLALHVALAIPERVAKLVLISASAGIEDADERAARKATDDALASEIEQGSIEAFISRWRTVPLFAHDPEWVQQEVAADERRWHPAALAACLRGLGAGAMTPMWGRLGELEMPVAVLAGERDVAYVSSGRRLAAGIRRSSFSVVPGVRHRVALEAPGAVALVLADG